ncbi:PE domain-containing protein [Actinophytocola glycyrrhizae]|uniref:PE domain-containing protein n=1 Tax=Actinophytocola glycyrrhizae TaxID=2044873 RepID=A0ABV9S879_9PSEU
MPFDITGAANPAASTSTLRVEPDQVLQLKAELQPIYDEVNEFLRTKAQVMVMRPLGADAVSSDTATALNENSQAAVEAASGYLNQLKAVLDALDQAVKTYNLTEDARTLAFRQVSQ